MASRKNALPKVSEKSVQEQCLQWLRAWGAFPIRVNSGAMTVVCRNGKKRFVRFNSEPGCSDSLVCLPGGKFMALETKRPGERLKPDQESFLAAVEKRGGFGVWVESLEDLRDTLRSCGYDV